VAKPPPDPKRWAPIMGECEGEERVAAPYPVPRTPADCSGELLLLSCGADAECLAERVVHPFRCCFWVETPFSPALICAHGPPRED